MPLHPGEVLPLVWSRTVSAYPKHTAIVSVAQGIQWSYIEVTRAKLTKGAGCFQLSFSFTAVWFSVSRLCVQIPQVDRQSTRLAHWLQQRGVGPGMTVGMFLPRSAQVYVTLLAILKTGAAYVPIDPEYPADRVSYILTDAQAPLLLTWSTLPLFVTAPLEERGGAAAAGDDDAKHERFRVVVTLCMCIITLGVLRHQVFSCLDLNTSIASPLTAAERGCCIRLRDTPFFWTRWIYRAMMENHRS